MLRVAVIGGGPSGSCAAEILAKAGIETWLFERKLDNAKPCGGAIPLCMVEEFDLEMTADDFLEIFAAWPRGLMTGAAELVSSLATGLQRGCLSNTNELHWWEQKDAERVQSLFDKRFLSFEIGLVKPDREIFDFVLRASGIPGEAILFLDDNAINIDGALNAGLDAHRAVGVAEARAILEERELLS